MRLKLDPRARRLIERLPVINVYSLAELALMGALAVQVARLIWAIATPVGPVGDWRPAGIVVPGSPVDLLTGFDPYFRLQQTQAAPTTVTNLQLTVYGIRLDEATGRGAAIVAGPDGVQQSIAVGEEVQPGVTLKAVAFDHITLDRGGATEDLFLDQSQQPAAQGPADPSGRYAPPPGAAGAAGVAPAGAAAVPAASAGGALQASQLRQQIGFIPRLDNGRISGLVVRPQGGGETFRRAGLREGDVITSIGGRPVTGPGDVDRIASDFAAGGNIPITVERGQDTLSLAITIAAPNK